MCFYLMRKSILSVCMLAHRMHVCLVPMVARGKGKTGIWHRRQKGFKLFTIFLFSPKSFHITNHLIKKNTIKKEARNLSVSKKKTHWSDTVNVTFEQCVCVEVRHCKVQRTVLATKGVSKVHISRNIVKLTSQNS